LKLFDAFLEKTQKKKKINITEKNTMAYLPNIPLIKNVFKSSKHCLLKNGLSPTMWVGLFGPKPKHTNMTQNQKRMNED
jgi:hypothetical protein